MSRLDLPIRYARMRSLGFAWFLNALLGAAIGSGWLEAAPGGAGLLAALYLGAALLATVATLAALPAVLLWLCAWIAPFGPLIGWLQAAVWTLFQLLVFADTRFYARFRHHLDGLAWNLMTSAGAGETFALDAQASILLAFSAALLFALELFLWNRWLVRLPELVPGTARARRWRRAWVAACGAIVAVALLEKGLYAAADFDRDRRITVLARHFPLYQRLKLRGVAHELLGLEPADRSGDRESLLLRYPIEAPAVKPGGARPNILIVVVHSLRADMLAAETMPEVVRFAGGARRFENHLSGGNAMRFGLFSLIYGIHGSYSRPVREERTPPLLVTILQRLGYEMRILSTASPSPADSRPAIWVTIADRVEDDLPHVRDYERDEEIARRFEAWMKERSARKAVEPFLCLALIDVSRGRYDWPPAQTRFEPYANDQDFLAMASSPAPDAAERVFNSYKNAVWFADGLVGRILMSLRKRGLVEDTLVVITGDHGEEFFEHGYFGHTSNFTAEQVRVPFVLGGPGIPPGVETRPTSHVDLCPTLLEHLGADPGRRAAYTHGIDLLDPPPDRQRAIASAEDIALWVEGGILRIPLEGRSGFIEGYDYDWTRLTDEDALIARQGAAVARLAHECREFLR